MAQACTLIGHVGGGAPPKASISDMRFQFSIDKETRNFEPGEVIEGKLNIVELPWNLEEICALLVVFEGKYYSSPDQAQGMKVIQTKKAIVGNAYNVTGLGTGEYKFGIQVPLECPPSFSCGENGGQVKYSVRCVANRLRDGLLPLRQERLVYVTPTYVSSWVGQDDLGQPMVQDKELGVASGTEPSIHVWLKTNQKCYSPGQRIEFSVKVKNGATKKIRCIKIHLIQLVYLKSNKTTHRNDLGGINNGPSVESNSSHVWSGHLETPVLLPASAEHAERSADLAVEFRYKLQVTLQIGGYFSSTSISEEFAIQIGKAFATGLMAGSAPPLAQQRFEPLEMTAEELNSRSRRSMSVLSLTPSLPDYRTALLGAVLPPAYSTLDISLSRSLPELSESEEKED